MNDDQVPEATASDADSGDHQDVSGPAVVGVAASPIHLDALGRFFAAVRPGPDVAYVVVLHLHEAVDESRLLEAVAPAQGIQVTMARDNLPVEAGCAYLAPPNTIVTIEGGGAQAPSRDRQSGRARRDRQLPAHARRGSV